VTIQSGTGTLDGQTPNFSPGADDSTIDVAIITAALNLGTSVTVDTGSTGSQAGDITVATAINKTAGGAASLTLNAANDILLNASVTSSAGALDLHLVSGGTTILGTTTVNLLGGTMHVTGGSGAMSSSAGTATLASATQVGTFSISGGTVASNNTLNASVLNLSAGVLGGSGNMTVSTDFNQTGGTFNPTGSVDLTRSLGLFSLGTLNSNGTIRLVTTGLNDIQITGNLQATNSGLANNVAAISVTSGRDILLGTASASRTSLTSNTSGAIRLQAAGNLNLKVNDNGSSNAATAVTAAGNLDFQAGGSIIRTDTSGLGLVTTSGQANLVAVGSIQAGDTITAPNDLNVSLTTSSTSTVGFATATAGNLTLTTTTSLVTTGDLVAGQGVTLSGVTGIATKAITASNGTINISNSGTGSDIVLDGDVQATNTGLAANVAAISVTSGRDILLGTSSASRTDLTSTTSGAIRLQAAGDLNLKVNDNGSSNSATTIAAAGNLDFQAGGSIIRTDTSGLGLVTTSGLASLVAVGSIQAGDTITGPNDLNVSLTTSSTSTVGFATATAGNLTLTTTTSLVTTGDLVAGQGVTLSGVTGIATKAITASNGTINISNSGTGSDIVLDGDVQATNTGLASNVAAISVTSGRDILLGTASASATNLTSNTSGAIRLQAAGDLNLKVNDNGNSNSATTITAAGNLDFQAGGRNCPTRRQSAEPGHRQRPGQPDCSRQHRHRRRPSPPPMT
jgi:hypothetical protein